MKKKIFVAISGGIDSSVSLALLKKKGFDCTGVFFKLMNNTSFTLSEKKANQICKLLNVPFKTYDFKDVFETEVISYFIEEYKKGRTPNPCIVCNRKIKFDKFLKNAMSDGADFIATGHYAKNVLNKKNNTYQLKIAKDRQKDQTYFLYRLNQDILSRLKLPLGNITKEETVQLANEFNLPFEDYKESQDVCFLKNESIQDFLKRNINLKKGKICDTEGNILGSHNGFYNFTIGQRAGLGIGGGPYYVIKINTEQNKIIASKNKDLLYKSEVSTVNTNWIDDRDKTFPMQIKAALRYTHKLANAKIVKAKNHYKLIFKKPQRAPTPGQSAVFYIDNICIGGGVITK